MPGRSTWSGLGPGEPDRAGCWVRGRVGMLDGLIPPCDAMARMRWRGDGLACLAPHGQQALADAICVTGHNTGCAGLAWAERAHARTAPVACRHHADTDSPAPRPHHRPNQERRDMTSKRHDNFINGEWVPGTRYAPNINPSNVSDVIGEYTQGDESQLDAAVAAARAAVPAWATGSIQARSDALDRIGNEILARKEELGTLLAREEGKTKPEGIGEAGRAGQIFKFFAGECLRLVGRDAALGAARHRRRDHPRAGRRGRPDHALEFSDRHPGMEDRAGPRLRQLRGVQAGRPGAGLRLGAGGDHLPQRHPGRRVQPGDGPRQRGRRSAGRTMPASTRSASPARRAWARASPGCAARPARSSSWRWAARTRRWCSTMPTSAPRSRSALRAPSSRPASAARRRAG